MKTSIPKHLETGRLGEDLVVKFLKNNGFSIVDRNYRQKQGEIDIIARQGSLWHFVEVKTVTQKGSVTRERFSDYEPEDNIHLWKRQRLAKTIEIYLLAKHLEEVDWQVDAISVYLNSGGELLKLDWLEDILLS